MRIAVLLIVTMATLLSASEFALNGRQSGIFAKGEYLVDSALIVAQGTTATFRAGAIVRFKPFARMDIGGTLICEGTRSNPVLFTSHSDRPGPNNRAAAPFDWAGIFVENSADSVIIRHTRISFSASGISIASSAPRVVIDTLYAWGNGTADIASGSRQLSAVSNEPLVFYSSESAPDRPAVSLAGTLAVPKVPAPAWTAPTLIFAISAVAAGGAVAGIAEYRARAISSRWDALSDLSLEGLSPEQAAERASKSETLSQRFHTAVVLRTTGAVVAGAGLVGLAITIPIRTR